MPNNEQAVVDMYYNYAGLWATRFQWEHLHEDTRQMWRDHYARTHGHNAVSQEEEE